MTKWFRPQPTSVQLVFRSDGNADIDDLRSGIRFFLTTYYPSQVALRMSQVINFNYHSSRSRRLKFILLSADGSTFSEAILLDLFARLSQGRKQLCTFAGTYHVRIEGNFDANQLNDLCWHYFWLHGLFQRYGGSGDERYEQN